MRHLAPATNTPSLLEEVRVSRQELLEATGLDEEALLDDYPWIQLTDALSLVACRCFAGERERASQSSGRPGAVARRFWREEGDLVIDPLPLAGATRFRIPCRRIENRRYSSDVELTTALARARWEALEVRVRGDAPAPEA